MSATDPLARWRALAEERVLLPSGLQARIVKSSPDAMLRSGGLPPDLRVAVMAITGGEKKASDLAPDELSAFLTLKDDRIAAMVRFVRHGHRDDDLDSDDGWEAVRLTGADLAGLPSSDVEALNNIDARTQTVAQVTAYARREFAIADKADEIRVAQLDLAATRAEKEAAGQTTGGFPEAGDRAGGAQPGAHGADVGGAPEPAAGARPGRSGPRSRRR